ncbi:MAG TPA: ABC transporter ATP-binding protein [Mycobacteriales bacterium]|jgi:branched-chain amino acid transport system ATP-binding protein|nr:ABC transporter ATP-binding protein [Mycobacteriales bacterium]
MSGDRLDGAVLEARDITVRFGGFLALQGASLVAEPGQVTSLIGPNGAGKTTLFHAISGILAPEQGETLLDGRSLRGMTPDKRARAGMARTFQILELFSGLSVAENLQVAVEGRSSNRIWRDLFSLRHPDNPDVLRQVREAMDLVGIAELADRPAGSLPTGLSRLVELARALCTDPQVLLLDEPASGLSGPETDRLHEVLTSLADLGLTILLVEHDIELVMALSKQIYVLDFGAMIANGTPKEVRANPAVRAAYLGTEAVDA